MERIGNLSSILAVGIGARSIEGKEIKNLLGRTVDKDGTTEHLLPWEFGTQKGDMKHFRSLTEGNIVVMGYNTWMSLNGKPLKNRMNIVLTSKADELSQEGVYFENPSDIEEYLRLLCLVNENSQVFIIGGLSLYKQTADLISTLHLSCVDFEGSLIPFPVGTKWVNFPNLDHYFKLDTLAKAVDTDFIPRDKDNFYPTFIWKYNYKSFAGINY